MRKENRFPVAPQYIFSIQLAVVVDYICGYKDSNDSVAYNKLGFQKEWKGRILHSLQLREMCHQSYLLLSSETVNWGKNAILCINKEVQKIKEVQNLKILYLPALFLASTNFSLTAAWILASDRFDILQMHMCCNMF